MKDNLAKVILLAGIGVIISTFFILDFDKYLTFDYLKQIKNSLIYYNSNFPLKTAGIFFIIYITLTSVSLPAAGILTIASGVIFGLLWGTIIVSIAGPIGATIAFLASRFLFRDIIQSKFSEKLVYINKGIENNGKTYLLTLRLVPIIPFFILNLLMGLTAFPVISFCLVSFVGMLPITILFVNAGTQIATINSPADILSLQVIASFLLIGIFPLLARKLFKNVQL